MFAIILLLTLEQMCPEQKPECFYIDQAHAIYIYIYQSSIYKRTVTCDKKRKRKNNLLDFKHQIQSPTQGRPPAWWTRT